MCGHGQCPNIIQYHFMSLPGQGKRLSFSPFWEEYSFLVMGKAWWVKGLSLFFIVLGLVGILHVNHLSYIFHYWYCCCSFSYLMDDSKKWLLTYLCLLSSTERERGVQFMVSFSVGILNWRILFLNHNIKPRRYWRLGMGLNQESLRQNSLLCSSCHREEEFIVLRNRAHP